MKVRNVFAIFVLSGFWHGANWTFIAWGALNAIYFLPLMLSHRNRIYTDTVAYGRWCPSLKELIQMGMTFSMTLIAWVFFRAGSIPEAISYLEGIFSKSLFSTPKTGSIELVLILVVFILTEWIQRDKDHALQFEGPLCASRKARWSVYVFIVFFIYQWF